jgi:vacuolar-type H+-ATPase subunit E/Vma4
MKSLIDQANDLLTTHELVTAAEYKRVIRELIKEVSQAYEDGCNVVTTTKDFTPEELDHERRSA